MGKYWFVDEKFNILEGEDAKNKLLSTSDVKFLSKKSGITNINNDRWRKAQEFETKTWMEHNKAARDDRNMQHTIDFDYYKSISKFTFHHAIELGCGPFTNLRIIGQTCKVKSCTLLDPLIDLYLKHPFCTYDRKKLNCEGKALVHQNNFIRSAASRLARYFPPIFKKQISIRTLLNTPIEEMPSSEKYDLIILINVIEHCYDIYSVFANIMKILAPGAILIFHDKYYYHHQVKEIVKGHYYEAGHPLMVDRKVLDEFLGNFSQLYRNVVRKEISHIPVFSEYEGLFYIGQAK